MFTARNGDSFRDGLLSREQKDPQYDFLKPGSINYGYYAALVEQYKSTMLPARGISQTLRSEYATPQVVLKRLTDRATWENAQETARKNAEEEAEAERIAYAQIDWQDFVVVETINFDDDDDNNDELPAPKVADKETANANEEEEEEKEERTDNNEGDAEGKKKSEDGHRPGKKKKGKQLTQVCPICHLEIPVEEFSEHMRIELLDPNGKKQKELGIARAAQSALASGDEISANLARFARSRKDIFGLNDMQKDVLGDASKPIATAEDHTQEAPSVAQPPQPAPVPVPVPVPAPTKMGGQPLLPLQMPPAPPSLLPMIPGMMGMMPPPPQPPSLAQNTHQPPAQLQQQARVGEEEEKKEDKKGKDEGREAEPPVTKKQHIERTVVSLVTEETFLKENGGGATSANISVVMPPAADANKKAEYKRLGEVLKLSCTLSGTICDIKNMIREETNIPVNKQKLSIEGIGVLKDAYTLAFYNVSSVQNSKMTMKFKERGGKKK